MTSSQSISQSVPVLLLQPTSHSLCWLERLPGVSGHERYVMDRLQGAQVPKMKAPE